MQDAADTTARPQERTPTRMARNALPPYEVGSIKTGPPPKMRGMTRARASYRREEGGPLHDVYGTGKTVAAAKRDLKANLARKREQHHGGSEQIDPKTT